MHIFPNQGSMQLAEEQWYSIELGDLLFYIMKSENIYSIATDYQPAKAPSLFKAITPISHLPDSVEIKQKIYSADDERPYLSLQLADKPYEVNPAADINIAPHAKLILYVSTPVWLQINTQGENLCLAEYPTVSPRLSWVGASTTEGSLCYSTDSTAPSVFSQVKHNYHRALTALELINDGNKPIKIDRLSLPLPILSLYRTTQDSFWTESVRYRIHPESGETTVVAGSKPPEEVGETTKIASARDTSKTSRFRTAMNLILG
ncbi:MAG: hypothetical protein ACPGPF_03185 [Pontibacterium sp.]